MVATVRMVQGQITMPSVRNDPEEMVAAMLPLPCTTDGRGDWKIRPGLELDEFCRKKVEISVAELREERDTVRHLLA